MIIYVAGSYSGNGQWAEKVINTYKAIDAGIKILLKGHYALIPHLTHFIDERMDVLGLASREKEFWYDFDNIILPKCDGFIKISSSGGADAEEAMAYAHKLKIFKTIDEIPDALH